LFLALPDERPGFGAWEADATVRGIRSAEVPGVPRVEVEPVGGGHAGVLRALEFATGRIAEGRDELCIVGGVDSYLDAKTLYWLEEHRRLARDGVRGGFSPGEAAGMLAIASRPACVRLGVASLARVRGVATAREPRSLDSEEGLLGEGLSDVVRRSSQDLRLPLECIDGIYCDINGERHRTDEWGFTVLRLPFAFRDGTAYVTAVDGWADVGAASGALNCMLAVQAWQRGYAPGPRALVWGSSTDGLRGATVLDNQGN